MNARLSNHDLAGMIALARQGFGRSDIAAMTGWSVQTIGKRIGHLVPARHLDREPDVERHRRMLRAVEAASYGEMDAIAKRFGLKNALVLRVVLVRARRLVAEADPPPLRLVAEDQSQEQEEL